MRVRVTSFYTQIHGVSKYKEIEEVLNRIGSENILHIATIGIEMIVVYKERAE